MKILILASNPRKDLNLDDELRIVQREIDRSANRDQFSVVKETGVLVGDLQRLMHRHKPEIIHFCGHGSGQDGLIFKVDGGGEQRVKASALASLFRLFDSVKCVLLNACYSAEQATAIAQHTDYVIGMSNTIQDNAAIAFSKGFYTALGEDCSIEMSFELGKNAIQLEVSESSIKRSGATAVEERKAEVVGVVETTELKEHEKPRIFIRGKEQTTSDLDQSRSSQSISDTKRDEVLLKIDASLGNIAEKPKQQLETNTKTPDQPRSHETRTTPQWGIDQSQEEDTNVKQYRAGVFERSQAIAARNNSIRAVAERFGVIGGKSEPHPCRGAGANSAIAG
jgi:CHAT domain